MGKDLEDFLYSIETANLIGVQSGLAAGIDPNSVCNSQGGPLLLAITSSSASVISALLDSGAEVEKIWEGQTQAGAFKILRRMLSIEIPAKIGMDLFLRSWPKKFKTWNSNGVNNHRHPLHIAARHWSSSFNAIESLIEHGANPDVLDDTGKTPAHVCVSPEVIKFLASCGARCDVPDIHNCTPLWEALGGSDRYKVFPAKVRALLDAGINPNNDPKARYIYSRARKFLANGVPGSHFLLEDRELFSRLCDTMRPWEMRQRLMKTASSSKPSTRLPLKRVLL